MTPADATTLVTDAFAVGTAVIGLVGAYNAGKLVVSFIRR